MDAQAALETHLETAPRPITERDPTILFVLAAVIVVLIILL